MSNSTEPGSGWLDLQRDILEDFEEVARWRPERRARWFGYSWNSICIEGARFGRLVALYRLRGRDWRLRCDCGKETIADTAKLRAGRIRSCGCLAHEMSRERVTRDPIRKPRDLTGSRFGLFEAVSMVRRETVRGVRVAWRCRCACGEERIIPPQIVTLSMRDQNDQHARYSCGCQRRPGFDGRGRVGQKRAAA